MGKEFEVVEYRKLKHIKIFVNDIMYRNVHFHNEYEIILVLDGTGGIQIGSRFYTAAKGGIFIVNPNESHEFDNGGNHLICLIIQISSRFLNEYAPEISSLQFTSNKIASGTGLHRAILDTAFCFLEKEPFFRMNTVSGILEIFRILTETEPFELNSRINDDLRLTRMRTWQDYIEEHADAPLSLDDLAEQEQLSATYVSHLFREYFGITFQEYLNNVRFERALFLLNSTTMPVYDLALAAGFSDPKYLNEQFRKHFDCSVRTYRKLHADIARRNETRTSLSEKIYFDDEALSMLEQYCS